MPKGPNGQKRPADVVGNAVRVMEIATGQREEECERSPDSNNTGGPKDPPSDQSTYQDPNDDDDVLDEGNPDEPDDDED